ncbi:hypothetical protein MMC26_005976 [Xylographa opegraphella]|nr:hypothetical protein [Xylographa opegraphella]
MPVSIETTPCPVHVSFTRNPSRAAARNETAGNVDFTCDLQAAFKQAAPRRKNPPKRNGAIQIFDDEARGGYSCTKTGGEALSLASKTTTDEFTQTGIPAAHSRDMMVGAPVGSRDMAPPRNEEVQICRRQNKPVKEGRKGSLRKEPRRRTIYVPSEDTTILTIHPGSHYTNHGQTELITQDLAHYLVRTQRTKARQSLAAAPRRAPLQSVLQRLQENKVTISDMPGRQTGKENVPPGGVLLMRKASSMKSTNGDNLACSRWSSSVPIGQSLVAQNLRLGPVPREGVDRLNGHISKQLGKRCAISADLWPVNDCCPKKVAEKVIKPVVNTSRKPLIAYALLDEDISYPQMFEENWLNNQETAITQIVNGLFKTTDTEITDTLCKNDSLRHDLMQLYQESSMLFLYERLEASLNYGALRPSTDSMMECCRLMNDVGIRRRFNDLWMKTYNIELLRCAAEVVVGREAPFLPTSEISRSKIVAHNLEAFIEACLLRNEDSAPPIQVPPHAPSWFWRRTLQRCLMLVLLLDIAKNRKVISSNLFRTTSAHKSSSAVLKELTCLLVPNGGDIGRILAHLDYHLTHIQNPLSEYNYMVGNLAVDLRDGIRLAHLVEILLYPTSRLTQQHEDITVAVPSGEVLTSLASTSSFGVLSQHLKFPCQTKASRLYNVQIVLSALSGLRGITSIIKNVRSEDVVDGHREKTMILLWGLVGKWGLEALVDKIEVKNEIRRFETQDAFENDTDSEYDITEFESNNNHGRLLLSWAKAIARKRGLQVRNLSTCFADGKVVRCIVDEYQPFIVWRDRLGIDTTLETKLKEIGCTSMFGCIARDGRHFGEDFTIAALAFLCSRLLGASKKRRVLAGLASECVKVVVTRNTVIGAAVVLQRCWRAHVVWKETRRLREQSENIDFWLV